MKIHNGCLLKDIADEEERVQTIPFDEKTVQLPEASVLVAWKQALHWMPTKQIGDGMSAVYVAQRPFVTYELDLQAFVAGLCIYHEYDEVKDLYHYYLYRHPKGDAVDQLNKLFASYELDLEAVSNRFVELKGDALKLWEEKTLLDYLKKKRTKAQLSFLFGLVIGYGQLRYDGDVLHHALVQVPWVGSSMQYKSLIQEVLALLEDHDMFIISDTLKTNAGEQLQISIGDREILYHIDKRYQSIVEFSTISKRDQCEALKQETLAHVADQGGSKDLADKIDYGVVKKLNKS